MFWLECPWMNGHIISGKQRKCLQFDEQWLSPTLGNLPLEAVSSINISRVVCHGKARSIYVHTLCYAALAHKRLEWISPHGLVCPEMKRSFPTVNITVTPLSIPSGFVDMNWNKSIWLPLQTDSYRLCGSVFLQRMGIITDLKVSSKTFLLFFCFLSVSLCSVVWTPIVGVPVARPPLKE